MFPRPALFIALFTWALIASGAENCWEDSGCVRITGIGHGFVAKSPELPLEQRQLLAIRAAKIDAVRSLAEQIKGIHIQAVSSLDSAVLNNDTTVIKTDTLLRGVRYVSVEPVQEGLYRAVVEMDVFR